MSLPPDLRRASDACGRAALGKLGAGIPSRIGW